MRGEMKMLELLQLVPEKTNNSIQFTLCVCMGAAYSFAVSRV